MKNYQISQERLLTFIALYNKHYNTDVSLSEGERLLHALLGLLQAIRPRRSSLAQEKVKGRFLTQEEKGESFTSPSATLEFRMCPTIDQGLKEKTRQRVVIALGAPLCASIFSFKPNFKVPHNNAALVTNKDNI